MATKVFQFSLCIFLITLACPLFSHARPSKHKAENQTTFDFIKNLEGCQKGQTAKGLEHLRTYLEAYGYLNNTPEETPANDDSFDDALEAAIKMYQLNFHLNTTGTLDAQTLSQMIAPRCGVPDIVNGINWMQASKRKPNHTHDTLPTISYYSFGRKKWPPTKYELTYGFKSATSSDAISAVSRAFNAWSDESVFTFTRIQNFDNADLKIGFYRGNHGDRFPFDGPNGPLAHAFRPTNGKFHYNEDRSFSVDPVPGSHHLETVALHEIGHLLGLLHSDEPEAIMFPTLSAGTVKGLDIDDKYGIAVLYDQEPLN